MRDSTIQVVDTLHPVAGEQADSAVAVTDSAGAISSRQPVMTEKRVAGVEEPLATYNSANDDVVSTSIFVMLVMALLAVSASWGFILRQSRNFFYRENEHTTGVPDTNNEIRSQLLLTAFAAFIFAVMYYTYFTTVNPISSLPMSKNLLMLMFVGVFVLYFMVKAALSQFVNWVFFDGKEIEQWNKSQLFITTTEGVMVTPIVLLFIYAKIPLLYAAICAAIVIILGKIGAFYKCYLIFFKRFAAFLQLFLYFCALELIPLAALVGILESYNGNSIIKI